MANFHVNLKFHSKRQIDLTVDVKKLRIYQNIASLIFRFLLSSNDFFQKCKNLEQQKWNEDLTILNAKVDFLLCFLHKLNARNLLYVF